MITKEDIAEFEKDNMRELVDNFLEEKGLLEEYDAFVAQQLKEQRANIQHTTQLRGDKR